MQDSDQLPWLFLTSLHHDPAVYGYRAAILERHYPSIVADAGRSTPVHRVCAGDEAMFTTLTCQNDDDDDEEDGDNGRNGGDFHRRYRPYQRLVAVPDNGSAADDDGRAAAVEAVALRFTHDDVKLIRRRLAQS